jgi:hypothetical protein
MEGRNGITKTVGIYWIVRIVFLHSVSFHCHSCISPPQMYHKLCLKKFTCEVREGNEEIARASHGLIALETEDFEFKSKQVNQNLNW